MSTPTTPVVERLERFHTTAQAILDELRKIMVGQDDLIHNMLVTLLAGGNALMEGVPGLGKTLLVRTLAQVVDCTFNQIQFTPDLMPADILGTLIISETPEGHRGFRFERGPVFANLVLADEINRAAPRTQSALLEAMQEQRVTVAGETYRLPAPFFVLATQNPIEMEGTYPLPEAQLDRFFYKIDVPRPKVEDLIEIARRTTGSQPPEVRQVANSADILAMQALAAEVPVEERVYRYAALLVDITHPDGPNAPAGIQRNLRLGISPRGIQALIKAAKVEALLAGRKAVSFGDIRKVFHPALRHRLILTFEAQAEGISADALLDEALAAVPQP